MTLPAQVYTELTNIQEITTTFQADEAIGLVPDLAADPCDVTLADGNTTNGNKFANTGREFVYLQNPDGPLSLEVTFNDQSVCTHGFDHDVVTTIAPTTGKMLGPFPVSWFTRTCLIDYDYVNFGNVATISIFQLPAMSPGPGQG